MSVLLIVVGALVVLASIGSGFAKFSRVPAVMSSMESVGVKRNQIPFLASLEVAGGVGVVVGVWVPILGVVSSACLALYFVGAVASHLAKKHRFAEFGPAFVILVLCLVLTYLQLGR